MKAALRCVGLRAAFMLSMGRSTRFSRVVSGPMDHSSARCSRYPNIDTLGHALPREMARVRDKVLPIYDAEPMGFLAEDEEHPGLWLVKDQQGAFMGRQVSREAGAAFLAAWFVADEDG